MRPSRVPVSKRLDTAKLSRLYRDAATAERTAAEADAPVLTLLRATLATCAESCVRAWVAKHILSLTANVRTSATALRMIAEWWNGWSDPLFDESDDFWIWARAQLTRRQEKMALTLMITGDNLADVLRQCGKVAAEGVEGVPGVQAVAHTAAEQPAPVVAAAPKPAAKPVTLDDVRTAVAKLVAKGGAATVATILKGYGVAKLPELDAAHYAAVLAEVEMSL